MSRAPADDIFQLSMLFLTRRVLGVLADIGIADALGDEAAPVPALAEKIGVNADHLARCLRLTSSYGCFEYDARQNRVAHNDTSRRLRTDHPQSMRPIVHHVPIFWDPARAMEHTVKTGRRAMEVVFPEGEFVWFKAHPEHSKLFDQAMTAKSHRTTAGLLAAYDFSGFGTIADIGGGRGHLINAILGAYPNAKGLLFDLPHVVSGAQNPHGRLTIKGGSWFDDPLPSGADAYVIMDALFNWPDEEAVKILKAIRRAAAKGSKLLVVESVLPPDGKPHPLASLDMHMMVVTGGHFRTQAEWEKFFGEAGFRFTRLIDTNAGQSIVEGTPAD